MSDNCGVPRGIQAQPSDAGFGMITRGFQAALNMACDRWLELRGLRSEASLAAVEKGRVRRRDSLPRFESREQAMAHAQAQPGIASCMVAVRDSEEWEILRISKEGWVKVVHRESYEGEEQP